MSTNAVQLKYIKTKFNHDRRLRILDSKACVNIRKFRISRKKARRGRKTGNAKYCETRTRSVNFDNLIPVARIQESEITRFTKHIKFVTLNAQSTKKKDQLSLSFINLIKCMPKHVSVALYIVHWLLVLANLLSNEFWGGATSSHLNSLGSIQGCCLIWHTHLVKPLTIITHLSLVLEGLEALWLGTNLMVHKWSLMCTNHIDMIAHTPAFLTSWVPLIYMWSVAQLGLVTYHTMEQCQQDSHPSMY